VLPLLPIIKLPGVGAAAAACAARTLKQRQYGGEHRWATCCQAPWRCTLLWFFRRSCWRSMPLPVRHAVAARRFVRHIFRISLLAAARILAAGEQRMAHQERQALNHRRISIYLALV